MNIRTWHRLCWSGLLMFPAALASILLPEGSLWQSLAGLGVLFGIVLAVIGALMGILLALGRLRLGCPRCKRSSKVTYGGEHAVMVVECERCGDLRVPLMASPRFRILPEGELLHPKPKRRRRPVSPLLAIRVYPKTCVLLLLPVLGSIVAAAVIHEFIFIHLLIPGFIGYAVAGSIADALHSGVVSGRGGVEYGYRENPIRYGFSVLVLLLMLGFCICWTVGYAIQERDKELGKSGQPRPEEIEEARDFGFQD